MANNCIEYAAQICIITQSNVYNAINQRVLRIVMFISHCAEQVAHLFTIKVDESVESED